MQGNSRQCPECGKHLEREVRFCPQCGLLVAGTNREQGNRNNKQLSSSSNLRDITVIVGILAIVTAVYFILKQPSQSSRQPGGMDIQGQRTSGIAANMLDQLPDDYNALVNMANRLMDERDFPAAAAVYRQALAINDESPDVRTDFGACLHGIGLAKRAIEEFIRVVVEYPEHGIAHVNLGTVYFDLGQMDSARYYWERAITVDPDGRAARLAREFLVELGD